MGMYDTLFIDTNKLPISEVEKKTIGKKPNWQTKDFDCVLTEIYITDKGELKVSNWKYEEVPKEERPYPNDEGLLGAVGSLKRVNEKLEVIKYAGVVNFYSDINKDWYEFYAIFKNGKLEVIKGGKE